MSGDASFKTMRHMETVRNYLTVCVHELLERGVHHDQSKLEEPEKAAYAQLQGHLRASVYGSPAYFALIAEHKEVLDHHYTHNRHHPEFHAAGIAGMTLIDLLEMLMDWKSASLRHDTGDVRKSIEINQRRFGYGDELKRIFSNTIDWLDTQPVYHKAEES
jgi:hypothetical protein